ncbi:LysR family transcriptional regulator [Pararobbsia alpina]|uniref:Nodulation protein D 2 n=1 Tax=Pararobbsia alpina TaxID=621374 RepID=A0A6S7B8K2_9BURK|nr:LysR family transcriptional regulator [Pararobbsia alpina]CAB3782771.1 Nodulation protein D 2 [Pararobbsia alpina]
MNLRSIDLNLLVVLEALVTERSVTRAAEKVGLSQSAVSHALRRLRTTFRDELFVRTPEGMVPTSYAISIASVISGSLRQIERAVEGGRTFDPASAIRGFNLRLTDYAGVVLLPRLISRLREVAPGVQLNVQHFDPRSGEDSVAQGEVHVRAAFNSFRIPAAYCAPLLEDSFSVMMNREHPYARAPLTLEDYLSLHHLKVANTAVGTNAIDDALAAMGLVRKVAVTVPSWLQMQHVIETTDLITAVPHHWTGLEDFRRFATCPLPIEGLSLAIDLLWHPKDDDDIAQGWFRLVIRNLFHDWQESFGF